MHAQRSRRPEIIFKSGFSTGTWFKYGGKPRRGEYCCKAFVSSSPTKASNVLATNASLTLEAFEGEEKATTLSCRPSACMLAITSTLLCTKLTSLHWASYRRYYRLTRKLYVYEHTLENDDSLCRSSLHGSRNLRRQTMITHLCTRMSWDGEGAQVVIYKTVAGSSPRPGQALGRILTSGQRLICWNLRWRAFRNCGDRNVTGGAGRAWFMWLNLVHSVFR
jgi:hypothetical protein